MTNVVDAVVEAWHASSLRRRYEALATRERRLLGACAALVVVLVCYAGIGSLVEFRQRSVERYLNEQRDLEWMKRNQHLIDRGQGGASGGELLSTVVNSTAAEFGFRPRRTQTESDGVSARIEGERFDNVLRWAHALETRHGVEITNADIDLGEPGRVDARFTLR